MSCSVILLAAGYGTRLYPLTQNTPKALLPIGDRVLLDILMDSVKTVESVTTVHTAVLVSNSRFAQQFRDWQKSRKLAAVQVLDDGTATPETRLGAIGDLDLARKQPGVAGDLLVLGTDNLFHWPLSRFVSEAQKHAPHASIGLWKAPEDVDASQFGVVKLDEKHRVTEFVEKSPNPPSRLVSLAMYYYPQGMQQKIGEFLKGGGNGDAPGYFLEWLVKQGPIYGVSIEGDWYDIGSIEAYQEVQKVWKS